jgi:hypothetical protein
MNDSFKTYSLKIFNELNHTVLNKFNNLESKELDKNVTMLMKVEEYFNEMDSKLDMAINKMVTLKINKEMSEEINFIN